jgi:NAD(P)-dependent dehydrogenase (short-subunit alcohol dehydrogenase family)
MKKTALVTGSNRGIGLEFCKQLHESNFHVIATCRQKSKALAALGVEIIEDVDIGKHENLLNLAKILSGRPIDWLLNNAGIANGISMNQLTEASILSCQQMFMINSLGALLMTQALIKNMSEGSKVGLITSRMGSIADNNSGGSYGYRMSKAALNAAGKSLAIDLKPQGISVAILHPGWVKTAMTGHGGLIETTESVSGLIARMNHLTLDNTGGFWHTNGEKLPW